MVGFLTHTGYAHGGNGFEGVNFLLEQFRAHDLRDPGDPAHGINIKALAAAYAIRYADYKAQKKSAGSLDVQKIPGVNHPVFKDKPVNHDPREKYVRALLAERGEYNVFHEYYHALVEALFEQGVSRTVYCVNIDAVIASLLLKMMWKPYREGSLSESAMETAAFTIFLYGRMLGCAAEIEDHLNRGRNMDMRTPASQCQFMA
jgi:citrate synthase